MLVQASISSNTFVIQGVNQVKDLTELVPGILSQMGPESLGQLRKLAESYQAAQTKQDDDDVPDLVESFDETA